MSWTESQPEPPNRVENIMRAMMILAAVVLLVALVWIIAAGQVQGSVFYPVVQSLPLAADHRTDGSNAGYTESRMVGVMLSDVVQFGQDVGVQVERGQLAGGLAFGFGRHGLGSFGLLNPCDDQAKIGHLATISIEGRNGNFLTDRQVSSHCLVDRWQSGMIAICQSLVSWDFDKLKHCFVHHSLQLESGRNGRPIRGRGWEGLAITTTQMEHGSPFFSTIWVNNKGVNRLRFVAVGLLHAKLLGGGIFGECLRFGLAVHSLHFNLVSRIHLIPLCVGCGYQSITTIYSLNTECKGKA